MNAWPRNIDERLDRLEQANKALQESIEQLRRHHLDLLRTTASTLEMFAPRAPRVPELSLWQRLRVWARGSQLPTMRVVKS